MEEKYFVAKVQYDLPDENTGRIKKIREEKLVNAISVTDVEAIVTKKYEGFPHEWRITSVSESKINEVFDKDLLFLIFRVNPRRKSGDFLYSKVFFVYLL